MELKEGLRCGESMVAMIKRSRNGNIRKNCSEIHG